MEKLQDLRALSRMKRRSRPGATLLRSHPEPHRNAAGALWSLAENETNQLKRYEKEGRDPRAYAEHGRQVSCPKVDHV